MSPDVEKRIFISQTNKSKKEYFKQIKTLSFIDKIRLNYWIFFNEAKWNKVFYSFIVNHDLKKSIQQARKL
uniref:hypothetical protein n=1 Tax=Flavobacterium sp. TaxID=239 RepID=UPI0037BED0AE